MCLNRLFVRRILLSEYGTGIPLWLEEHTGSVSTLPWEYIHTSCKEIVNIGGRLHQAYRTAMAERAPSSRGLGIA